MKTEEWLVREYFGGEGKDPKSSERMMEHHEWHMRHENNSGVKSGNMVNVFYYFTNSI